ncbi:sugar ABC transporter permease [Deinococcus misasensis]|uniref:sugar ABC transporter permease n=1 Tax=Deinococcus misasensis TaxID=392413 RepID=UPI00068ABD47|nr:sugar ABC transporter permease [Deinococcus misasensis]
MSGSVPKNQEKFKPYVHREPSIIEKALPWVVFLGVVGFVIYLGSVLFSPEHYRAPLFPTIVRVENGWVTALMWLLGAVGALGLVAFLTTLFMKNVRGRKNMSFWAILGDQVTHLTLWIVIFGTIYPLFYVLAASFDPRNSLYNTRMVESENLLVRSKVLPDFSQVSWENYEKLIYGVQLAPWHWGFIIAAVVGLVALLVINLYSRITSDTRSLKVAHAWVTRAVLASIALLVITLTPAQFTGPDNENKFLLHIRNTLLVSGITGAMAVLLSTTGGYAVARFTFPGRYQTMLTFVFLQMIPTVIGLVAVYFLLSSFDLSNTFTGLILAYAGGSVAFNIWIFKGYVEGLPISLEEAALVDGASRWQVFTQVILPLSGPMLVFMFLNTFIGTYAEFILASVVLTGVENWTVGISLRSFTSGQFSTKWGIFAAASVVGALPIVALFYTFQQYFVGGQVAGGVKE